MFTWKFYLFASENRVKLTTIFSTKKTHKHTQSVVHRQKMSPVKMKKNTGNDRKKWVNFTSNVYLRCNIFAWIICRNRQIYTKQASHRFLTWIELLWKDAMHLESGSEDHLGLLNSVVFMLAGSNVGVKHAYASAHYSICKYSCWICMRNGTILMFKEKNLPWMIE